MAQLTRERIMEMEEEMNRFEQEISQPVQDAVFRGQKVMMLPPEPDHGPPPPAIQFIPHQLRHPNMGGPGPPRPGVTRPMFMGQMGQPFPPQNMMGPMHMAMGPGPGHNYGPPRLVGHMPVSNQQSYIGPSMGPRGFPPGPVIPAVPVVVNRPQAPPEPAIMAAPTVYASPPVKLVTVFHDAKSEAMRPLPPPPPIPAMLKPEIRMEGPPQIHKGVVGRPPEHSYEEPTTTAVKRSSKKKKIVRLAGSQVWEDNSLLDWELDDFRIFCGDLGNDVTDEILTRAFGRYPSFIKAKVVRDKRTNKTKGYGFVSFKDPQDFIKAMKEMNGKYVGSRPIKLRKSSWRDRNIEVVRKKQKEKEKLGLL